MTTPASTDMQEVIQAHDQFMSINYPRYPIVMARGEGSRMWDADGKEYLDLFAGFGATILGHCHPALVEAVSEQAKQLWHVGNLFHTEPQTRVARHIAEKGFGGRSFFCHSGADANEAAIKLSRLYGKANPGPGGTRFKVISATQSFHGRSFGTMGATGQPKVREGFGPHLPGFVNVAWSDMSAIEAELDDDTIAIMLEPIQGEGGINLPVGEYMKQVRELCDDRNMLMICDEVWTGCGRTGEWFGYQHWEVTPDVMTLGKGVGGGLPVGVMCALPRVAELYDARKQGAVKHASTLGGNCLAMAAAAAVFETIERENLLQRARDAEALIVRRFKQMAEKLPCIRDIRGRGMFIGIELDPRAHGAWFGGAADVVRKALDEGLWIGSAQATILRLAPALTISNEQLNEGLDRIERILAG